MTNTNPAASRPEEPSDEHICGVCFNDPERCDIHDCGDMHRSALATPQPPTASQPGWQPIATAPTNGMRIILGIAGTTVYPHDELCHLATWDGVNCHPYVPNAWTHWHALPAAPRTKDSK